MPKEYFGNNQHERRMKNVYSQEKGDWRFDLFGLNVAGNRRFRLGRGLQSDFWRQ
jgi:hypothetical protein